MSSLQIILGVCDNYNSTSEGWGLGKVSCFGENLFSGPKCLQWQEDGRERVLHFNSLTVNIRLKIEKGKNRAWRLLYLLPVYDNEHKVPEKIWSWVSILNCIFILKKTPKTSKSIWTDLSLGMKYCVTSLMKEKNLYIQA